MKPLLTALAVALTFAAAPAQAIGLDIGSMAPTLTYPVPTPDLPTQDATGTAK